jgi:hypothetical protein
MAHKLRVAVAVVAIGAGVSIAGCSDAPPDTVGDETGEAQTASDGWQPLGQGVAYKRIGDGPAVFIGYAGWSVQMDWARAWVSELQNAKLASLGVGHAYAVQGPRDVSYSGHEIENSRLAAHLLENIAADAPFILVAAHSSGSYVAHELITKLFGPTHLDTHGVTDDKVVYANLDGGGGLDARWAQHLKRSAFVWAEDTTIGAGRSANAATMQSLARAPGGLEVRLQVDDSGCNSGARWCLHDTLITTKPHNPGTYDLRKDYSDFDGRPVQAAWVDALRDDLPLQRGDER